MIVDSGAPVPCLLCRLIAAFDTRTMQVRTCFGLSITSNFLAESQGVVVLTQRGHHQVLVDKCCSSPCIEILPFLESVSTKEGMYTKVIFELHCGKFRGTYVFYVLLTKKLKRCFFLRRFTSASTWSIDCICVSIFKVWVLC